MRTVAAHSVDRFASAKLDHPHAFAEQLIDQLADDLITLNAEGGATIDALTPLGWELAFIEANVAEARRRANSRFVRQVASDPQPTPAQIERDIAGIVLSHMPPTQLLVAECMARGISKQQLDLLFNKGRAQAAYAFALGHGGETH